MTKRETMESYLTRMRKLGIITNESSEHKGAINDLCLRGIFSTVRYRAYDGRIYVANCMLTAEEHLKKIGQYDESRNTFPFPLVEYLK